MTVAELIAKLQEMPQDFKVKAYEFEVSDYDDIVELDKDSESVFLVTEAGREG